jgi:SAM-dependent methyltransferase
MYCQDGNWIKLAFRKHMKDFEQRKSWYRQVANIYTSQQRKNWYSEVADAYNKTRPRYPQELIHRAVELAQLPQDALILEVGCGPGTATTAFAQLGFSMLCLEPSQKMCQLARHNCIQYPSVEITNTSFEEWQLEPGKFNAVLAATSFHWVSSEIGYAKAADALKEDGYLVLLWNMTPQPQYEVYEAFHEVYQTQAPTLGRYEERETQQNQLRRFGKAVIDSGLFKCLVSEQLPCEITYSIDDYLMLLSTLSPYIVLDPQQRNFLFAGLRQVLEKHSISSIPVSFLSAFHIAQKI